MATPKPRGLSAKDIGGLLLRQTAQFLKEVAVEFGAIAKEKTPKLTNFAASNWRLAIDRVPSDVKGSRPKKKNKNDVLGKVADGSDTGLLSVLRYKLEDGVIFSYNNVPYIRALNAGHSKKAPAAFVEAAIKESIATGDRAFADAGKKVSATRTK